MGKLFFSSSFWIAIQKAITFKIPTYLNKDTFFSTSHQIKLRVRVQIRSIPANREVVKFTPKVESLGIRLFLLSMISSIGDSFSKE